MISVNEATRIIQQCVKNRSPLKLPLYNAFGLTLAEDVYAIADIPAFAQSSMDGYAFNFSEKNNPLTIAGEMAAGAGVQFTIQSGQTARIFTGAPLPDGTDTVVMQEKIIVENDKLINKDIYLQQGDNVRSIGAEVKKGALAMSSGTYLSAAAIGFLAGIGITQISVFPRPSVTIILTGNELQEPGKPLNFGQVYEANSLMLTLVLEEAGIKEINVLKAEDEIDALQNIIDQALKESDVILLTGGVSVGDYDFVVKATQNCGVQQLFHKIKQKPGKPLFFGMKEDKIIFGLPGNPSSVLTCYYEYVLPALEAILKTKKSAKPRTAILTHDYIKSPGLTHFLKAKYKDGKVTPLHAQDSFRLHSFAQANCLIKLNEEQGSLSAGNVVEVHLLPNE